MDLRLDLDLHPLEALGKDLRRFEDKLNTQAATLAGQTHLHVIEQVQQRLHSRRAKYIEALARPQEIAPGVWVITLDAKAVWVEEGLPQHSMVKDLLTQSEPNAKPARWAKDGSKYRVIPFVKNKAPNAQTEAERMVTGALKKELKKLGIPWGKVERNPDGSPRSGLLHKQDFDLPPRSATPAATPNRANDPSKPANQHGMGHGSVGQPMQGPVNPGEPKDTGIPFLHGVRIYQTPLFKKDKDGKETPKLNKKGEHMARRTIMTFRVVSSKHEGSKWEFPGIEGCRFFDEAIEWGKREWDTKMLPELVRELGLS